MSNGTVRPLRPCLVIVLTSVRSVAAVGWPHFDHCAFNPARWPYVQGWSFSVTSTPELASSPAEDPSRERTGFDPTVRTALVASLVGTTIEWYDFFLYATA